MSEYILARADLSFIKYFSSFAAVKLVTLFFANFTAAKDEKYFSDAF